MDVVHALQFHRQRQQKLAAAPAAPHLGITQGDSAFAAGNQRNRRFQRVVVCADLSGKRGIHLGHFTRFARDAIAQNHGGDAVLLEKRGRLR